ncbi:MAG TPA: hypothetical protein DCY13_16965 [Verrucomicrobiales bacterium]|nr:hypothetical protein [Verrucomicrobiales bacterium]
MLTHQCTQTDLDRALHEIRVHATQIVAYNRLDPQIFQGWIDSAAQLGKDPAKPAEVDRLSLHVVNKWIESLPELQDARNALIAALAGGVSAPSEVARSVRR